MEELIIGHEKWNSTHWIVTAAAAATAMAMARRWHWRQANCEITIAGAIFAFRHGCFYIKCCHSINERWLFFFCYLEPAITKIIAPKKSLRFHIFPFNLLLVYRIQNTYTDCPSRFLFQISQLQLSDKKSGFPSLSRSKNHSKCGAKHWWLEKIIHKFWVASDSYRNDFHITWKL